jgi:F-type H+-transporting ATPase subunit c
MTMEQALITGGSILGAAFAVGLASIGAGVGDGVVTGKFVEGISKKPESKSAMMINMLISVGLIESVPIIAVVIALVFVFANPFIK